MDGVDNVTIYTDSRLVKKIHFEERETEQGVRPARDAWRFSFRRGTKLDNIDLGAASIVVYFEPHAGDDGEAWINVRPDWEYAVRVPRRMPDGETVKDEQGQWVCDTYNLSAADLATAAMSYLDMDSWLEVPESLVLETNIPATRKDGSQMLDRDTDEPIMVKSVSVPYGTTVTDGDTGDQVDVGGATFLENIVYPCEWRPGHIRIHHNAGVTLKLRMPALGDDGRQMVGADGKRVWEDDRLAVSAAELARKVALTLARRRAPRQSPARRGLTH